MQSDVAHSYEFWGAEDPAEPRRVDGVLVASLAACAGGLASASWWTTALVTCVALVVLALRGTRFVAIFGAFAFLVGAVRGASTIRSYELARERVIEAERWPATCVIERGVVVRSPIFVGNAYKIDVDVTQSVCSEDSQPREFRGRITLHVPASVAPSPLTRGATVEAVAHLAPGYRFWNADTGDPRPAQARRGVLLSGGAEDLVIRAPGTGVQAFIDRLRERLRGRIVATFPSGTQALARALVLGEDDLASVDQKAFRESGLAHLLAVSGMHLVLVIATLVTVLRAAFVRMAFVVARVAPIRLASAVGVPLAWMYADLAGGSGSAVRAAWMTSAALLAHVFSRKPDVWRAFALSMAAMVLADPLVAFDLSFGLSAAATAGLLVFSKPLAAPFLTRVPTWLTPLVRALSTSLAASMACAPVLATMSRGIPIAGLVANLIAVPLGELAALPLCLAHGLLELFPSAERGCALAASGALGLVRTIALFFSHIPGGSLPVPTPTSGQLAVLAAMSLAMVPAFTRKPRIWLILGAISLVGLEFAERSHGAPKGLLRVSFLDVGQGDSAIVDLPDGTAFVIDGGGLVGSPVDTGERVLAPVLRARRRHDVRAAMLSHPHPDHFAGLRHGLDDVALGELWDTGQGEAEGVGGDYAELLRTARARGVSIRRPESLCGMHMIGGVRVEVLAPCPRFAVDRGANDNSFVMRITYGERAFLFVGDAEHVEESELLARAASAANTRALKADVLKVGHHGSRTSTSPAFLKAVDPLVAVISCGVRNRFGHPATPTLATLAASRARVLRTDRDGGVMVTTDGHSLNVETASADTAQTPLDYVRSMMPM